MPEQLSLKKEQLSNADVDAAIIDAVEKGLDHFGPTFKTVVFHELRTTCDLERKSIGRRPIVFSEFLDAVFTVGADTIRNAIVQEIGKRFSISTS
jgi:hypothetical protein